MSNIEVTKGYQFYKVFLAVRMHFDPKTDYDYIKYNGQTNISVGSFRSRRDRWTFEAIGKDLLSPAERRLYAAWHFFTNAQFWPKHQETRQNYKSYLAFYGRTMSFGKHLLDDLGRIQETTGILQSDPLDIGRSDSKPPLVYELKEKREIWSENAALITVLANDTKTENESFLDPITENWIYQSRKFINLLIHPSSSKRDTYRSMIISKLEGRMT